MWTKIYVEICKSWERVSESELLKLLHYLRSYKVIVLL